MNLIYFTVGPSKLHPKFEEFFKKGMIENMGSISHRGDKFMKLYDELVGNLKKLFNVPEGYSIFYGGSGTEFMERSIQNCSEKNTLHFIDGEFGKKFSSVSKKHGRINTEILSKEDHSFDLSLVPVDCDPELICLTHNETTTGTALPRPFLNSVRKRFPNALIVLDIVSSAPVCDVDFSLIDCAFFSIQKGFGLPAGLGVMFVSPKALKKAQDIEAKGKQYTGSFHSFASLTKYAERKQTPETPNVFGMYLLNEACLDYLNKGLANLISETKTKAELIYSALEKSENLKPLIKNKETRSETVIVAEALSGSKEIMEKLKQNGFLVGGGYGAKKETQIRIANFPSHTKEEVMELCKLL